jgi:tetratricopeptide (TPR) repeat protein
VGNLLEGTPGLIVLEEDRARGERLLRDLEQGRRTWAELDREEQRLSGGVALIELIRQRSRSLRFDDPEGMVELAKTGCTLTEGLDAERYGDRVVADLRAQAWAELGNAYRVADDFENAGQAFGRARELVQRGIEWPPMLAEPIELLALFLAERRLFREATQLLEYVESVHRQGGRVGERARILLTLANIHSRANEPERAILLYLRALSLLEPGSEHRLAAVHGLALNLAEAGFYDSAQHLLASNRRLYRRAGRLNELRLIWLEGKLAFGLGELGKAEGKFNTARLAFLHVNKVFDAALVGLDLALLYTRQERRRELAWLVDQMLGTFRALGIAREAIASLLLLRKSCEQTRPADVLRGQIEALARLLPELESRKAVRRPADAAKRDLR